MYIIPKPDLQAMSHQLSSVSYLEYIMLQIAKKTNRVIMLDLVWKVYKY